MLSITVAGKGGAGKSATAWHVGAILAESRRVLLVDVDAQGTLTNAVGVLDAPHTLADVLGARRRALADTIAQLAPTLALAPSGPDLTAVERDIAKRYDAAHVLAKALDTVADSYDVAIVDTPPALGLLTVNALTASAGVIVPCIPEAAGLLALNHFLAGIAEVREQVNPKLEVIGIVPTFYNPRLIHHEAAIEDIRAAGLPLLRARIGRSVRIAECVAVHKPLTEYEPANERATEYRQLTREVITWLQRNPEPR